MQKRTSSSLRAAREGGETMKIDETKMLQYLFWLKEHCDYNAEENAKSDISPLFYQGESYVAKMLIELIQEGKFSA